MATLNFTLRNVADKRGKIFLRLSVSTGAKYIYTGFEVEVKLWDARYRRVKPAASVAEIINTKLKEWLELGEIYLTECKAHRSIPNKLGLSALLFGVEEPEEAPVQKTLIEWFDIFLEAKKSVHAERTPKPYISLRNNIEQYKRNTLLSEVNDKWIEAFVKWLINQKFGNNTISGLVTRIKTVLYYAREQGEDIPAIRYKLGAKKYEPTHVALTADELAQLENVELKEHAKPTRELFLLMCYSGLRFSDATKLSPDNIQGDKIIIRPKKVNRKPVIIPITKPLRALLARTEVSIYNQHPKNFQYILSKICKKAGLNRVVSTTHISGSNRVETTKELWEVVSPHTARRTFATLSLSKGVPIALVSQMMGHASINQTMRYAKFGDDELTTAMKAWD